MKEMSCKASSSCKGMKAMDKKKKILEKMVVDKKPTKMTKGKK